MSDTFQSINPATGEVLETFPATTRAEVEQALSRAEAASHDWRRQRPEDRATPLRTAARLLRERAPGYARTMALEMGKPLAQGKAEADKCAWACDYYAEHGPAFLVPEARATEAARSYVRFDPLGPIVAIMPWNFPFWQVLRFAAPALMAGNVAILKHAPGVPRSALDLVALFRDAGFPDGVFQSIFVDPVAVARVIADPRVRGVTLTGSPRAGAKVAEQAGRYLKKTVLELGGSDPFIVLEDADLAAAARAACTARLVNSGQSCIAAKRFIVVESVANAFIERFGAELQKAKVGDPLAPDTQVGPLARLDLRTTLHRQVEESVIRGAQLVVGGQVPEGPGAFYPPTILTAVSPGMPAFDEETFGPVAAVIRARDESEALRLANASAYGLGGSVWTGDRERAERLAGELEVGCVFVNEVVKSDPRLPFGGVKWSGYGRELSEHGLREFVNVKSVWIA
ncbi:MAG TPA: NAD-dependent succinate-semialdehyde dehydrogenase [Polyangiaceae bacterium]